VNIKALCSDWTSMHEIRKAVRNPKGDPLLSAVKDLVRSGELEERGGAAGIKAGQPYGKGQYQVRRKP
jgi:hypothetical protein